MLCRDSITEEIRICKEKLAELESKAPTNSMVKSHNFYGKAKDAVDALQVLLEKTDVKDTDKKMFYQFVSDTLNSIKSTAINPSIENTDKILHFFADKNHCFSSNICNHYKKENLLSKLKTFAGVALFIGSIAAMFFFPPSLLLLGAALFFISQLIAMSLIALESRNVLILDKLVKNTTHVHIDNTIIRKTNCFVAVDKTLSSEALQNFSDRLSLFAKCSDTLNTEARTEENIHVIMGLRKS